MFIKMNLVWGKYFIFFTMHDFTILLNTLFMHLPNLFRVEAKNISGSDNYYISYMTNCSNCLAANKMYNGFLKQ